MRTQLRIGRTENGVSPLSHLKTCYECRKKNYNMSIIIPSERKKKNERVKSLKMENNLNLGAAQPDGFASLLREG